ncbi:SH3 domain-containing protein [Candidatus Parcubacteria bacterium]|nr:SH3 domain-containing protein [Candidatus Parcubacteria bacterium]MCG2809195.1 SH3 domain-containing protein [Candidatus Portnoybacteria bacterium]
MKKIVITVLALLLIPATIGATADQMIFDADTSLEVNGYTVTILSGGKVDDMVVTGTNATFTLSTNSGITIRSTSRYQLSNNLGLDISCGTDYSQISASGSSGSSLVLTVDGSTCSGTVGGGGGGGGGAAVTPTPTTPTTSTGAVTATADGGGQTTLTTDENTTAAVSLPIGAVSASTNILITAESKATVTASKPVPIIRSVVGGYVYNYTATASGAAVSSFSKTLTLTFTYTDAQISGLTESNLRVFYWKELTSQWVALTTTVNAETNTLTAETDHFTYFAIMGLTEGTTEEEDLVEEAAVTTTIIDGDLIRNPNASGMAQFDIYIVKLTNGKMFKRLILSPHVFESYEHFDKNGNGSPWDDVMDVAQSVMNEYTTSDLVRAVGDTKVYQLIASGDTGTKQWLNMTATRFAGRGHSSDSIYEINETDRNAYAAGADIVDAEEATSETIIIKTTTLRVRNLPSLNGKILTEVHEGEVYDLLDEQDGWYKITANGVTGWCYGGDTGGYAAKQ